jgi:hypothetical protein
MPQRNFLTASRPHRTFERMSRRLWTAEQRQLDCERKRANPTTPEQRQLSADAERCREWRRANPRTPEQRQLLNEASRDYHRANRDAVCEKLSERYYRVKPILAALDAPHRGAPFGRRFTTFTCAALREAYSRIGGRFIREAARAGCWPRLPRGE